MSLRCSEPVTPVLMHTAGLKVATSELAATAMGSVPMSPMHATRTLNTPSPRSSASVSGGCARMRDKYVRTACVGYNDNAAARASGMGIPVQNMVYDKPGNS